MEKGRMNKRGGKEGGRKERREGDGSASLTAAVEIATEEMN